MAVLIQSIMFACFLGGLVYGPTLAVEPSSQREYAFSTIFQSCAWEPAADMQSSQKPTVGRADSGDAERDIPVQEALLRYLFPHAAYDWHTVKVFFIETVGSHGLAQLLQRFQHNKPPVRDASRSGTQKRRGRYSGRPYVVDKRTGEEGVVFTVEKVVWQSKTEATVRGGYYHDGLGGMVARFRLRKVGSNWIVKGTMGPVMRS
jgi:hypothetical protein